MVVVSGTSDAGWRPDVYDMEKPLPCNSDPSPPPPSRNQGKEEVGENLREDSDLRRQERSPSGECSQFVLIIISGT